MSRCFPFPPPGYILNGNRDNDVIESIKIQGAEEKAKKEQRRKERKREKKEKKHKKRKEREGKEGESKKRSHKRQRKEEGAKDDQNQKVDVFPKLQETQIDCLEKSILTVERELLQTTSQNSCDSTLNSNELPEQKEKQPLNGRHNNDSESIIRIRLPIRRQKDPKVMMMTDKDQQKPCPSPGIKLCSAPELALKPRAEKRKDPILKTNLSKEKILSSSTQESSQISSLCSICPPSLAAQFLNVVENWVPNTIERRRVEITNSEDEECWWLSKKSSNHKLGSERSKQLDNEIMQVSSLMTWLCARFLPEADVHALPYTVPF